MDIATILTSVNIAKDTAIFVKDAKDSLSQADTKFKMAEIISALADTQLEIANLKIKSIEKDEKIKGLEESLNTKQQLTFDGSRYWLEGDPHPFCKQCHEESRNLIHLVLRQEKYIAAGKKKSRPVYRCSTCNYMTLDVNPNNITSA